MDNQRDKLGVFISLVLRHKPDVIGIELDEHGWANVDELIQGIRSSGRLIDRIVLEEIVAEDDKQRYSFNNDHSKIRANQGHSIDVDVELQEALPPQYLYHGTAIRFLNSIKKQGLTGQSRKYVHLSTDRDTAHKVGSRHGECAVLVVKAKEMYDAGHQFYLSKNHVWLCNVVPVNYINFG